MSSRGVREVSLTKSQARFHTLTTTNNLFCAGYNSGKTYLLGFNVYIDIMKAGGLLVVVYEPTYKLIKEVAVPTVKFWLEFFGMVEDVDYEYNKNDAKITTTSKDIGDILFMGMDNPDQIIAYSSFSSHIDELDTLNETKAQECYEKIVGRNRQQPKNIAREHQVYIEKKKKWETINRINVYTTPEGYRYCYKKWGMHGDNQLKDHSMVRGITEENPTVTEAFIDNVKNTYTEKQVQAYLYGYFMNMSAGTVYYAYDRELHRSVEEVQPGEPLFIGCDFNMNHMAATVYVKRKGGREWHAVDEFHTLRDTSVLIREITERYYSKGHRISMYPDASGGSDHTNATSSDIAQLEEAGFSCIFKRSKDKLSKGTNPRVKDRVASTNRAFERGLLFINDNTCPEVARCFEQQPYSKDGKPCKTSGTDHQNDASTYPIAYTFPIKRNSFSLNIGFSF